MLYAYIALLWMRMQIMNGDWCGERLQIPAPFKIILILKQDNKLSQLRQAESVPKRTRDLAHMLRLNAQGWKVAKIAEVFECHQHTVRDHL